MKCYSLPEGIEPPAWEDEMVDGKFSMQRSGELEDEFLEKVRAWLKKHGYTGKDSGKLWMYGVADGYAQYMVAEGHGKTFLIHLPLGDAYQIPEAHMRGLRVAEVRKYVNAKSLFGPLR